MRWRETERDEDITAIKFCTHTRLSTLSICLINKNGERIERRNQEKWTEWGKGITSWVRYFRRNIFFPFAVVFFFVCRQLELHTQVGQILKMDKSGFLLGNFPALVNNWNIPSLNENLVGVISFNIRSIFGIYVCSSVALLLVWSPQPREKKTFFEFSLKIKSDDVYVREKNVDSFWIFQK